MANKEEKSSGTTSRYLDAKLEWNERYSPFIVQARAFQVIALMTLTICIILAGGFVWETRQSRVVPFVVMTDKLGEAVPMQKLHQTTSVDPRILRYTLSHWITEAREVIADPIAERDIINDLYHYTSGSASKFLTRFYTHGHNPAELAAKESVNVQILSALPENGHTWRIKWRENAWNPDGNPLSSEIWTAFVTYAIKTPTSDREITENPLGIYVTSLNWTQEGR